MKLKLQQLMSRLSLFWRYFFLLAALVSIFLIAFSVASRQFTRVLQNTYLEQAQDSFESNAQMFVRDVFLTHSLPMAMEDAEHYTEVANAVQPLGTEYVFSLSKLGGTFGYQCMLLGLPNEGFMYFKRNGLCLTRNRVFSDMESCLDTYLIYEGEGRERLQSRLSERLPRNSITLPAGEVSIGVVSDTYLTVLVQSTNREVVYGFLYPVESVLEYFQLDSLPENTYLRLSDDTGNVLLSYGEAWEDGDEYIHLTSDLTAMASKVEIGIPKEYFNDTIHGAQITAQVIFVLSVLLGIGLCFLFSHISVQPFRRLIQDHAVEQQVSVPDNELLAIGSFLKSAKERNLALRGMLLSSLLVRAYSGLSVPEEEYKRISAAFTMFGKPLRAAIIHDRAPDEEMVENSALITLLRHALPERFLCEYINIQESVVLFPDEPELCEQLQGVMLGLNTGTEQEPRFACGISTPFVGANQLSAAIRQAQFCIPEEAEPVQVYMVQEGSETQSVPAANYDLKEFQQALACWNRQEALQQIEQLAIFAGKNSAVPPQELFYSMLFLLRDTAHSGKLSFGEYEKMTYHPTGSPASNLRRLKAAVDDLFEQKAALQVSNKQILCEEIVQYIKDNYPDPTLCMASVSKQFGVSERFVYNAVMETTGINVSNFLAQCRMQQAAMLLRDTDENISAIAEKCGYPVESTFYRNFKKYYRMTPAEYKSSH